jgi:hypothetical protein
MHLGDVPGRMDSARLGISFIRRITPRRIVTECAGNADCDRIRNYSGDAASGTAIAPAMAHQRHQVGNQQKCQRVRGDDRSAAAHRLGGHIDQRAGVCVDDLDRPLGNTDFIASVNQ